MTSKDDSSSCAISCYLAKMLLSTTPWEFPNKANHVRHAICQVLKHGDEPSDCESSCPHYYSHIEGLGLHVVYIARYVRRIKKHLRNRIEIESNCKEYESLHPYSQISAKSIIFQQNLPRKSPRNLPFFTNCFSAKLARKIPTNMSLKIQRNLAFFTTYHINQKPCGMTQPIRFDCLKILQTEPGVNLEVTWLCLCNLAHLWWKQSKIGWNVCFNFTYLI